MSARLRTLARGLRQRAWRLRLAVRRRIRRVPCRDSPVLEIVGPRWFADLFAPDFPLAADRAAPQPADGGPVTIVHSSESVPFVQPLVANPIRTSRRIDRDLPPGFARLASAARRDVPVRTARRDPATIDTWLEATATAHPAYRDAHRRTVTHVVNEALERAGRVPLPIDHEVAVVCATNRPGQLENIIENYERQRYSARRLVVVTNSSGYDAAAVARRLEQVAGATVVEIDERRSLGRCLNAAMDLVDSRFVAKFDDDDRYGADYLVDMMTAHGYALAGVVGKHSHLARFTDDGRVYVRFPGREFEYTSWVAGGTLVIDRERTGDLRFRDLSIGEDGAFLDDCQRAGHAVFAADRFNYVQHRTGSNTWSETRDRYLRDAVELQQADADHLVEP